MNLRGGAPAVKKSRSGKKMWWIHAMTACALLVLASGCGESGSASPFPTSTPTETLPSPGAQTVPVEAELKVIKLAWVESGTGLTVEGKPGLKIQYISSVGSCGLLSRVEVEETKSTVTAKVYIGNLVLPEDKSAYCGDVANNYFTIVELKEPLGDRRVINGQNGEPASPYISSLR